MNLKWLHLIFNHGIGKVMSQLVTAIREKIIDSVKKVEPKLASENITDATRLSDLNIDSLRLIELGVMVEDNFGQGVSFDDWIEQERARGHNAYTVESLVTFVSKAAHS
jgi:acyl carrier protein